MKTKGNALTPELAETTQRQWDAEIVPNDEFLAPAGRVLDSMLSEHQCEGWLEGYLLSGRHGLHETAAITTRRGEACQP